MATPQLATLIELQTVYNIEDLLEMHIVLNEYEKQVNKQKAKANHGHN